MSDRTTAATWLKGIADTLHAAGADVPWLIKQSGFAADVLSRPDARCETEQLSRLWEAVAVESGDPALALSLPHMPRATCFDVVAYVMMSCPTLHGALHQFVRYARIISSAAKVELVEDRQGFAVTLDLFGGSKRVPRQRYEFTLVTHLAFFRWLTAGHLMPVAADFANPEPADIAPYVAAFGDCIRFDQPIHRLVFSREHLMLPVPTGNPMLAELHDRCAFDRLHRLGDAGIATRTRDLVTRRLCEGEPQRAQVASDLCLSERTLQRRLAEEGASFQGIVDDVRRELAQKYMSDPRVSLAQVAHLLGFADQSAFFRASRRWFGMAPGRYRERFDTDASR